MLLKVLYSGINTESLKERVLSITQMTRFGPAGSSADIIVKGEPGHHSFALNKPLSYWELWSDEKVFLRAKDSPFKKENSILNQGDIIAVSTSQGQIDLLEVLSL